MQSEDDLPVGRLIKELADRAATTSGGCSRVHPIDYAAFLGFLAPALP